MRHNPVIVDFQKKRGNDAIAFCLPFLDQGMDVLDLGCGPGAITAGFSSFVRSAIGVDIEPKAVLAAKQLVADAGLANVTFLQADMMALPFDDHSVDAVFFHAVLYHLDAASLRRTLAQAKRVLKPNGLIATRDTDAGGNVIHPDIPGIVLSLELWQRWYEHSSDDAVLFGRRQSEILRSHGFEPVWSGASYVNHSADAATRAETVRDAKRSLQALSHGLIERGQATQSEFGEALSAWDAWASHPDSIYLRCRCECVARKAEPG